MTTPTKVLFINDESKEVYGDTLVKTKDSAGMDLRITSAVTLNASLPPSMVSTGIKVEIPEGHVGIVVPRSSMGKRGVYLANTVGVIDSDYRGEVFLLLGTKKPGTVTLDKWERVAQLIVIPCLNSFAVTETISDTERGTGGFGSTGKN